MRACVSWTLLLSLLPVLAAGARGGPSAAQASREADVKHVYIIGCGHSGTSLLLRTVGNLPHVRCLPRETRMLIDPALPTRQAKLQQIAKWDAQTRTGGFKAWVEKTPRYNPAILSKLTALDPGAKKLVIVRDGRDYVASLRRGAFWSGRSMQDLAGSWVTCANTTLTILQQPNVLLIKFEDLTDPARVRDELRRINQFLGLAPDASDSQLLLALQPPSKLMPDDLCPRYASEEEKQADLASSYLASLAERGDIRAQVHQAQQGVRLSKMRRIFDYRQFQMRQAWFPVPPVWQHQLSAEEQRQLESMRPFADMLRAYNYSAPTA